VAARQIPPETDHRFKGFFCKSFLDFTASQKASAREDVSQIDGFAAGHLC
jgi:hypothetical protein